VWEIPNTVWVALSITLRTIGYCCKGNDGTNKWHCFPPLGRTGDEDRGALVTMQIRVAYTNKGTTDRSSGSPRILFTFEVFSMVEINKKCRSFELISARFGLTSVTVPSHHTATYLLPRRYLMKQRGESVPLTIAISFAAVELPCSVLLSLVVGGVTVLSSIRTFPLLMSR
jgi:hypothetical protein